MRLATGTAIELMDGMVLQCDEGRTSLRIRTCDQVQEDERGAHEDKLRYYLPTPKKNGTEGPDTLEKAPAVQQSVL